jgi:DNA-binding cell septation regulator SpoVG
MRDLLHVTEMTFDRAPPDLIVTGLEWFASCSLGGSFRLNNLAIRRTRNGRFCVAFPKRRDAHGVRRSDWHPLTNEARDAIESQLLDELRRRRLVP